MWAYQIQVPSYNKKTYISQYSTSDCHIHVWIPWKEQEGKKNAISRRVRLIFTGCGSFKRSQHSNHCLGKQVKERSNVKSQRQHTVPWLVSWQEASWEIVTSCFQLCWFVTVSWKKEYRKKKKMGLTRTKIFCICRQWAPCCYYLRELCKSKEKAKTEKHYTDFLS